MKNFTATLKQFAQSNYAVLLSATAFYGIHFWFFHGGYYVLDDLGYATIATEWTHGNFAHTTSFHFRYATVFPLFVSYLIFGINDFANFASGFAIFISILLLVLCFFKRVSVYERWGASLVLIFAPLHMTYVEKPMPDIVVELGFLLSFMVYFHQRFSSEPNRFAFLAWSFGIIIAFLAKETFTIFYPYFLLLFLMDLIQKRNRNFWAKSIIVLFIFGMAWLVFNWQVNGSPLARINYILANHVSPQSLSACSYESLPFHATFNRIMYELWDSFTRSLQLFPVGFALFFLPSKNRKFNFIAISYIGLLLLSNFMTIEYTCYVPLCPEPRHYMFLLPIGAMVFAMSFRYINLISARRFFLLVLSLIVLLCLSVRRHYENSWFFFMPLIAALFLARFNHKKRAMPFLFLAFVCVYIQNALWLRSVDYWSQQALNDFVIEKIAGKKVVFTDYLNMGYGRLHTQFDNTKTHFSDFSNLGDSSLNGNIPQYVIENNFTLYFSGFPKDKLPQHLPVVYENKTGKVYRLK